MPNIPKLPYLDREKAMRDTISAAKAVSQGIATHAEKHRAERQKAYHESELKRGLNGQNSSAAS
jgi:hypothetical protein